MNIFDAFMEWNTARHEKRIAEMQTLGLCPDCRGKGFNTVALTGGIISTNPDDYHCPSCNGSGAYEDWEAHKIP